MKLVIKPYERASISIKFFSVSLIFLAPIIFLLIYTVNGFNGYIQFAENERKGVEILKLINKIMIELPDLHFLAKRNDFENANKKIITIDNYLNDLLEVTKRYENDIKLQKSDFIALSKPQIYPQEIISQFSDFKQAIKQKKDNLNELFSNIMSNINSLNARIGDVSNLILDPDLDSYYLMDASLLAIPQNQFRMTDLRLFLTSIDNNIIDSLNDRIKLVNFSTLFKQSDFDRIIADFGVAFQEDPNFYGVSPTLNKSLQPNIDIYTKNIENIIQKLKTSETSSLEINTQLFDDVNSTVNSIDNLWAVSLVELDKLLMYRIDDYKFNKFKILSIAIFLILIAYLFLFYTSKIIRDSIKIIAKSITNIAHGNILSSDNDINNLIKKRE